MERQRKFERRLGDKVKRFGIRLTSEEVDQLEYVAEKTGKTKTEVIRDSLRMNYNLTKARAKIDI